MVSSQGITALVSVVMPSPEMPDALSVRSGWLARRRRIVPADSIEQIDGGSKVIGLRVERESIRTFL